PITRTVRNAGQPCRPVARLCITLPSDRRVQKNLTTTVGTGYFDKVTTIIQGGTSSVTALTGSTEEEQF
ncbi:hypothetical protein M2Y09_25455, partial [Klebsiella pneumoniae]|nr:hypothetical protein [Klebsiella pneumoniae]